MRAYQVRTALERALPEWARYGLALLIVTGCFGARWLLQPYLTTTAYLLFFPGLLLSARLLGRGPTILATIVSAVLGAVYFIPPYGAFSFARSGDVIPLVLFTIVGLFIAEVIERLHDANAALRLHMGERDRAHSELAEVSAQRQLLLEEINHRIKNHLQSVSGLAGMSARKSRSLEEAQAAIQALQARLNVLARVYDRLRLTPSTASLDAAAFFESMCSDLRTSIIGSRPITILASADSVRLSADEAALLGLIVNELVANALKYAFPDDRAGTVSLAFKVSDGEGCLEVEDDGVGRSGEIKGTGLGTRLVQSLARQLGGEAVWSGPPGTRVRICFPVSQ